LPGLRHRRGAALSSSAASGSVKSVPGCAGAGG
jgi:hypothetical protein